MSKNQVLVETAIGIIWVILRIIELYLWLPTRLYGAYCSFHVASSSSSTGQIHSNSNGNSNSNINNSNGDDTDTDADAAGETPETKKIPTVVIVGGNFAGLAALWPLLDKQSPYVGFPKFRIVLIDQRDYSEYTPGILRLFVQPQLLDTLAQPLPSTSTSTTSTSKSVNIHPCHDYQFIHGKVVSILEQQQQEGGQKASSSSSGSSPYRKVLTYSSPVTSSTSSAAKNILKTLEYDYLILATGMTYRQSPITPDPQNETSLNGRLQSWKISHQQLKEAKKIIVIGGGAVGVELVAEIVDDESLMMNGPKKQITLIDVAPELVMNFPPDVRSYAQRWLERQPRVDLKLNQKLQSWTDKSCTLDDGTILEADIVYVCFGSKPNSEPVAAAAAAAKTSTGAGTTTTKNHIINTLLGDTVRGKVYTMDTLQIAYDKSEGKNSITQHRQQQSSSVLHDGCIFACGDVGTPPSSDEKQAFQAESQGKVAAHNVIKMMSTNNNKKNVALDRYPEDIAGVGSIPLIFILSLGKYDGVLGFNSLIIPGPLAAIAKWVLEYSKVLEMRGKILGRIIWIVAEHVVFFLARTILRPTPKTTKLTVTSRTTQQNVHTKKNS